MPLLLKASFALKILQSMAACTNLLQTAAKDGFLYGDFEELRWLLTCAGLAVDTMDVRWLLTCAGLAVATVVASLAAAVVHGTTLMICRLPCRNRPCLDVFHFLHLLAGRK